MLIINTRIITQTRTMQYQSSTKRYADHRKYIPFDLEQTWQSHQDFRH